MIGVFAATSTGAFAVPPLMHLRLVERGQVLADRVVQLEPPFLVQDQAATLVITFDIE